ncbi:MAG: PEP-utilizing enzyme [Actinomycetota bacterium]
MAEDTWVVSTKRSDRFPFYTRANVGEVFPDPVAPSSFSYAFQSDSGLKGSEVGFREAYKKIGAFTDDEYDPDNCQFLGVFNGYCYLNASMMRLLGHRAPGMTAADIDYSFFGDAPGVPEFVEQPGDTRPELTERIGATFQWALTVEELDEVKADEAFVNQLRVDRPDASAMSDREIWLRCRALYDDHFPHLFTQHIYITMLATLPVGIIQGVCEAVGRPEAMLRLMAGVGDVESAAPSTAMWNMGRMVRASADLTATFDQGLAGLAGRVADGEGDDAAAFRAAFDDFIFHYGSRGPNEWEVRCPTWETDPQIALAAIDRMRLAEDSAAPTLQNAARATERESLGAEIAAMVEGDPEAHGQFLAALRAATVFMPGRERTKTNCVKLVQEIRVLSRELGARWVANGQLEDPTDLAFLTVEEQEAELEQPGSHRETIAERKSRFAELSDLEEPFLFVGDQPSPDTWPPRSAGAETQAEPGDSLQGMPGCPGTAVGRARVVLDSADPTNLEPGDILVAPITDPSWTPLFVPAGGVVVNVGAPLSHAIIVSRELGIPCAVSVTDATSLIPDGALIEVDGDTGAVTVLEG